MTDSTSTATLRVRNLQTVFETSQAVLTAVNGVSFDIRPGEIHGLVGESGSSKSITAFSIMGLLEPPGRITEGQIELIGQDIVHLAAARKRNLRGRQISMIFQDPMMTLNPLMTVSCMSDPPMTGPPTPSLIWSCRA